MMYTTNSKRKRPEEQATFRTVALNWRDGHHIAQKDLIMDFEHAYRNERRSYGQR